MATASNPTDNGQCDPCLQYTPSGLPLNSDKPFPTIKKILSHISNWEDGMKEALLPTTYIIRALKACSLLGVPLPKQHVSSTPSAWAFKWFIDVANTDAAILHHNTKNLQITNVHLRRHLCGISHRIHQFRILLSVGILPLCVSRRLPFQILLSQSLISLQQRRHCKYPVMDLLALPGR